MGALSKVFFTQTHPYLLFIKKKKHLVWVHCPRFLYPNSRLLIICKKKIFSMGALSKVRQIRIADFIKGVVATRRWITDWKNLLYQDRVDVPDKLHAIFANVVALQM